MQRWMPKLRSKWKRRGNAGKAQDPTIARWEGLILGRAQFHLKRSEAKCIC